MFSFKSQAFVLEPIRTPLSKPKKSTPLARPCFPSMLFLPRICIPNRRPKFLYGSFISHQQARSMHILRCHFSLFLICFLFIPSKVGHTSICFQWLERVQSLALPERNLHEKIMDSSIIHSIHSTIYSPFFTHKRITIIRHNECNVTTNDLDLL